MVLLLPLGVGLLVGMAYSNWKKHIYQPPVLSYLWLVFAGFLPQFLAIYLGKTRAVFPDGLAALCVVISQVALFAFAWFNRHVPGMSVLLIGLILNLVVIVANGGFMPISPQTAERLVGREKVSLMEMGSRFGVKDILLPVSATNFEWLADRFLLPKQFPYQVAFSLGDMFIAFGAFWILAYQKIKD